jgi:CHAT domain-containing protein/tetratricopeptide (TPR) repeat protein
MRIVTAVLAAFAAFVAAAAAPPAPDSIRAHLERREYEPALDEARALLARAEADHGRDSLEAALALEWIARAMAGGHIGTQDERLAVAERALAIDRKLVNARDPTLAFAYYVVGLVYYLGGDTVQALPRFEQALALAEAHYGASDPGLEWYVREHGAALFSAGRYPEARTEFERLDVISLKKHGATAPGRVPALFNLALVQDVMGELEKAERLYLQAIAILKRQQPPDFDKLSKTYDSHAAVLASEGRLAEALAESERAIGLRRVHLGPESPELAESLVVQGRMLVMTGDYEKSREQLEAGIAILRRAPATVVLYSAYWNLAMLSRLEGNLAAARAALEQARRAGSDASLPEDHTLWFGFHAEYGEVLSLLGDRAAARAEYAQGLAISRATMGDHHYDYGQTLASLGRLDLRDGDAAKARERIERAGEIFEAELGKHHPLYVETEEALGDVYFALDLVQPAFTRSIDSELRRRELERATLAVLPERQALAQANRPRAGRDLAIALALPADAPADRKRAAYDALIRSRAIVFDEMAARQRLFRTSTDASTQKLLDRLRDAKTRLAGLFVQGPESDPIGYASRVRTERELVDSTETELARRSASYRGQLAAREFGVDELRRALPQRSACLSYVRYQRPIGRAGEREPWFAAVVQRSGVSPLVLLELGRASTIDDAVARWRRAIDPKTIADPGAETAYRIAAEELRRLVWDPAAVTLSGVETLFVVPDGSLNLVSLAALPANGEAYLLERGPAFHYLTAERDLAGRTGSTKGRGLLALGDPAFEDQSNPTAVTAVAEAVRGHTPTCASFSSTRFGPLPAAADEVAAVRSIWGERPGAGGATMLVGPAATELAFKRQAPGKQVLHLATHGFFLGDDCGAPGPYRGIGGVSQRRDIAESTKRDAQANDLSASPLMLSGLALAGANLRDTAVPGAEDGILTAEEVSALDLSGVRLAVLSACRTGAGRITSGEGVFGLRRAFLVAGAATVVTNLWDVEDRAGQAWIEEFYRGRLLRGRTIPEAVRGASLAVLAARRSAHLSVHPFYWAGWVAVGDPG